MSHDPNKIGEMLLRIMENNRWMESDLERRIEVANRTDNSTDMTKGASIIAFSTSNYDAMKKFLADFGFQVAENPHDQFTPLFNEGRGARIRRGDLDFNLEESTNGEQKASFSLLLSGYSGEEIARIKALGYPCEHGISLYGEFHSFRTPDGGTFTI